jgi:hypothetical protein
MYQHLQKNVVEKRISKLSVTAEFLKVPYPGVGKTGSDPDPALIQIQSGRWIRIQEDKNDLQNRKKLRNFMF